MNWIDRHDIIVYPDNDDGYVILYSPLARLQEVVDVKYFRKVFNDTETPEKLRRLTDFIPYDERPRVMVPEDYTLLTVLPNNKCNFSCSYCYSANCRNSEELSIEALNRCIDFFISSKENRPQRKNLTISYMGGGEPMLNWPLIRQSIIHAENKALESGVKISFRIITNGSMFSDAQIKFIKEKEIGLSISFEILKDIQNLQRKHFDLVNNNLNKVLRCGIDTQLNITITKNNVCRMVETYKNMRQHYPKISHAMFEPVTSQDMFDSPEEMSEFYKLYTEGFMSIFDMGKRDRVDITSFPYLRTVFPLKRACPGEFCITADGKITGCYCVSTDDDPLFDATFYGIVDDKSIKLDIDKFNRLVTCDISVKEECDQCPAKWNCGGGCYYIYHTYDEEYRKVVCEFTRNFVEEIIRYRAHE